MPDNQSVPFDVKELHILACPKSWKFCVVCRKAVKLEGYEAHEHEAPEFSTRSETILLKAVDVEKHESSCGSELVVRETCQHVVQTFDLPNQERNSRPDELEMPMAEEIDVAGACSAECSSASLTDSSKEVTVPLVAILTEMIEINADVLATVNEILSEVQQLQNTAERVLDATRFASSVTSMTCLIPHPNARSASVFVNILAGVVVIGQELYQDLKSDKFILKINEKVDEEQKRLLELQRFWGFDLPCIPRLTLVPRFESGRDVFGFFVARTARLQAQVLKRYHFGEWWGLIQAVLHKLQSGVEKPANCKTELLKMLENMRQEYVMHGKNLSAFLVSLEEPFPGEEHMFLLQILTFRKALFLAKSSPGQFHLRRLQGQFM
ncbi:unnamed protein product [Notodromas monacha]|uniref:Uncharacterized protein n=1 Tax=Notodromas monacha TaxID=399045 RepID=A0A7R9C0M7_9CRUS|nr:unnamed protein product [Notodromas monacha]CAG0923812.1 unnamed protein product [Notodromas monacha]